MACAPASSAAEAPAATLLLDGGSETTSATESTIDELNLETENEALRAELEALKLELEAAGTEFVEIQMQDAGSQACLPWRGFEFAWELPDATGAGSVQLVTSCS